ncbi:MAG: hypothetical protein CVU39_21075 [Chloroflexi bacterium HGW-Chloroflexi-10]|nr:MAG: hypothetical protein CVU39_21075 [Chloroflexi bacterium HGW-Chloroflexi-10]
MKQTQKSNKGQVIVIFAVSLLVLLFFVGLALDAGSLYVTYANLKRAVDSAAVAAANEFKRDPSSTSMAAAAGEVLNLMNVDYSNLELLLCDANPQDGLRDDALPDLFKARCPDTANGEAPRKLVWIAAEQEAPLYFLSLLGFGDLVLSTNTISEAAPLDVVIVLDTSESMASETLADTAPDPDVPAYSANSEYSPFACNAANQCQPMLDAKEAAKALIDTLADGYDQVAVVTFDKTDHLIYGLNTNLGAAKTAIDGILVHDDPPVVFNIWSNWYNHTGSYNPLNSEDLDGDGADYDSPTELGYTCPFHATNPNLDPPSMADRWWAVDEGGPNPYGWGGVPCDRNDKYDSMDWNGDGVWTQADDDSAVAWASAQTGFTGFTGLSTCSGCGLRQGANQLRGNGRFGAVWIMVFLSDGAVNLSDNHATNNEIPAALVNGFCGGSTGNPFWTTSCWDDNFTPRYCFDENSNTCPPGTTWLDPALYVNDPNLPYSVLDYAMDMVDEAALTRSANTNEPRGNEIAVYSIRLGNMTIGSAEPFLRYVAAVGDDGDRVTDPCSTVAANTSCGQYYFAPSGARLLAIFEDIASRIYTRISQ